MATPLLNESPIVLPVHRKILGFALIGWVFDFYDLMLLSFVIASTTLVKDLELSAHQVAILLGTSLAFTAIGGLFGGSLADRFGRKPMLIASILTYSLGTLLSGFATGMTTFLFARALTGAGVGAEWGVAHALVGETAPPHMRGRFGSILQSGGVFGRFFATLAGNFLAPWIGWRNAFIISALPALIVVLIQKQMPESDVWLRHKEKMKASGGHGLGAIAEMVGPGLRKYTALAFTLTVCNMSAFWFKSIWLPTYFHTVRGLSLAQSANLFFMDQIGGFFGYMVFGWAADRFGRRPSFFAFSLIKASGMLMLTFGWGLMADNQLLLFTVVMVLGAGEGNWGGIGPIINELFPTSVRASALGIIYNVSRGVQFLAPVLIAYVATRFSFGAGIALAAPFALMAGITIWFLPETKGVKLPNAPTPTPTPAPKVSGEAVPAPGTLREVSR